MLNDAVIDSFNISGKKRLKCSKAEDELKCVVNSYYSVLCRMVIEIWDADSRRHRGLFMQQRGIDMDLDEAREKKRKRGKKEKKSMCRL